MVQLWARQSFNISFLTCKMILLTKGNWLITWSPWKTVFLHRCVSYHIDYSSVQFSCSVTSDSLQPHGLQHARLPCPSPTPGACSNSCPLSWWWTTHLILHRPLFFLPSIFPSIRVFSIESVLHIRWPKYWSLASASVLPINIQDWFPLGLTGWISLPSKGLSSVFSNTTVQKHQFFRFDYSSGPL